MAFNANTKFDMQTGGNDTNGGGFNYGTGSGTDYALQAAKRTATGTDDSTTDCVANGTTTLTSATANFSTAIVGNIIYLQGGTGALAATRRQVATRVNATTITVDATVATGNTITMNIGGSLLTLGGFGAIATVAGNTLNIKSGTYTITSATANVAGGCFSKTSNITIEGYGTNYGDRGTPPLLQASGISTFTMVLMTTTSGAVVRNVNFDGASLTSSRAVNIRGLVDTVSAVNCTNTALVITSGSMVNCIVSGCTGTAYSGGGSYYACVAHTNAGRGFNIGTNSGVSRCISYSNTGANGIGFDNSNGEGVIFSNCVAYANAQQGFRNADEGCTYINCIAEDNTGIGFESTGANLAQYFNCAAFSNSTDFSIGTDPASINVGSIIGAATFFVNAAAGDFGLNGGEGADLKGVGFPTPEFPGGLTENFVDIGASQSEGGGAPGGSYVF